MANSAGIYLELAGRIFLLCDERWGIVPNGVCFSEFTEAVQKLPLKPGDPVSSGTEGLQFPGLWITIAQIDTPPVLAAPVEEAGWEAGLRALSSREKGLAPLAKYLWKGSAAPEGNPLCSLAGIRLKSLWKGLLEEEEAAVEAAVMGLLGLGPGLTPSGDDTLCGLLYGLLRSSYGERAIMKTLAQVICREADGRTHPVSAAYLKAIAEGAFFGRLEEAWGSITGRRESDFDGILEVGSSSGGDLLLGLLLAGKIDLEREE